MKRLFLILILTLSLQSWTKADDIIDLQIEGMSIGDSALDFFTKKEIEKNSYKMGSSDKYLTSFFYDSNYIVYDGIEITYKKNDKKFIIESVSGGITVDNIKVCKKKEQDISRDLKKIFPNAEFQTDEGFTPVDKYKKSKYYRTSFGINPNSKYLEIEVSCIFYKGQAAKEFTSNVGITIKTDEYNHWITNEAYK